MKRNLFLFVVLLFLQFIFSQNATIHINALSNQQKISPYIYGRNAEFSDSPDNPTSPAILQLYKDGGVRFARVNGGNNCSKYNWRKKIGSHPDWYNNNYNHDWDYAASSIEANSPDMQTMFGFQLIGWAASNTSNNFNDWAYNNSSYWSGVSQNLAGGGIPDTTNGGNVKTAFPGDINNYLERWTPVSKLNIFFNEYVSG